MRFRDCLVRILLAARQLYHSGRPKKLAAGREGTERLCSLPNSTLLAAGRVEAFRPYFGRNPGLPDGRPVGDDTGESRVSADFLASMCYGHHGVLQK